MNPVKEFLEHQRILFTMVKPMQHLFYLLLVIPLLSTAIAQANGGGFSRNQGWVGNFEPLGTQHIQMASEELSITLLDSFAEVRIDYTFHNPKAIAKKAKFGFPHTSYQMTDKSKETFGSMWFTQLEVLNYQIQIANKDVTKSVKTVFEKPNTTVPNHKQPVVKFGYLEATEIKSWKVSEMRVAANTTIPVSIQCKIPYSYEGSSISDNARYGPSTFSYILSSAAIWHDTIKTGKVIIDVQTSFPEEFKILSDPDRFKRNGNRYTWTFSDLEPSPSDDLKLRVFDQYETKDFYSADNSSSGSYIFRQSKYFFEHENYKIKATSTLSPDKNNTYQADQIRNWNGVWSEGVDGPGIGEKLYLTVTKPLPVTKINVLGGYAEFNESKKGLWLANNRVAKAKLILNGEKTIIADFKDHPKPFIKAIHITDYSKPVKDITMEILAVHKGSQFDDTCISNISLTNQLAEKPHVQGSR